MIYTTEPPASGEPDQAAANSVGADHPAWCSAVHCFVTDDGVRVHEQAPIRWEDDTVEGVRFESRLIDPGDDEHIYLDMYLQCRQLRSNAFRWVVPLDTVRRLRDQLTEHLDAAQ